ncbi:20532_t:CDS:2, partial [Racocetra persica]
YKELPRLTVHPIKIQERDNAVINMVEGYYVYFKPVGPKFGQNLGKYIQFSYALFQMGDEFYELVQRQGNIRILVHDHLPPNNYSSCVHIDPKEVYRYPQLKMLQDIFENMPYKMLGINCIIFIQFLSIYMTGKIVSYEFIPGYNLLLPPEERTIRGYIDFYFKPEYETIAASEHQVEDLLKIVEGIYPKVNYKLPKFKKARSAKSNLYNFFTDIHFLDDVETVYTKYREGIKTVWYPMINFVKYHNVLITSKTIYRLINHKINIPDNKKLIVDLKEIEKYYIDMFKVPIDLDIKRVKNELYNIGITIPIRKFIREIDKIIADLINRFKKEYPHPEGIFTRHLGTVKMVDKSNERYFTNLKVNDLEKQKEEEICEAVFQQLFPILEGNTVIPSVSHVFLKDKVLKRSKVELEEKIRSIIAQDPLTYYSGILVNAMDSTMTYPYLRMLKTIRKKGYMNHPNLYSGEVRMKHQRHSTGQSTVSPDNTIYCLTLFVEAWTQITGFPAADFFKYNYITAYRDDNILSSNCFNDKWNADAIVDYFAKRGISLRTEGEAKGSLNGIEFLSKQYYEGTKLIQDVYIDPEYKNKIICSLLGT